MFIQETIEPIFYTSLLFLRLRDGKKERGGRERDDQTIVLDNTLGVSLEVTAMMMSKRLSYPCSSSIAFD